MSLAIPKPGTFVHSPELGIEVTVVSTMDIPLERLRRQEGACADCVFEESRHADGSLCLNQSCDRIVWVDHITYAALRLTRRTR